MSDDITPVPRDPDARGTKELDEALAAAVEAGDALIDTLGDGFQLTDLLVVTSLLGNEIIKAGLEGSAEIKAELADLKFSEGVRSAARALESVADKAEAKGK